jgi:hypothetical protein
VLAGELRECVDRPRPRRVVLAVGLRAAPVEDVVGRHVHERHAASGELADRLDIDPPGLLALALAEVDVVEGRAVEHDLGLDLGVRRVDRGGVADVDLGVGVGARGLPQHGLEVGGQLAPASEDERPHRTEGNASSDGLTSCRSSSQRML